MSTRRRSITCCWAATAAGLRQLLAARGELADSLVLPVYVPVSLHGERPGQQTGNLISQMVVPLPVGIADPWKRLERIASQTRQLKTAPHAPLGSLFRSRLTTGVLLKFIARQRVNVETADLPGPAASLYFAGARVREVFPLVNLVG